MPLQSGEWKLDNFFTIPKAMKLPRDLHDCYFYYYSYCKKESNCPFRHESSSLLNERICSKWIDGQCFDKHCQDRHMFIEKKRSQIQCYWETTPNGCLKPHCAFKHTAMRPININQKIVNINLTKEASTAILERINSNGDKK